MMSLVFVTIKLRFSMLKNIKLVESKVNISVGIIDECGKFYPFTPRDLAA